MSDTTDPITVQPDALDRILADAALFASRDDTLPMLNGVELAGDGAGNMTAFATNRFIVGVARATYTGPEFRTFLRLPDVLLLRKVLSPKRNGKLPARLLLQDRWLRVALVSSNIEVLTSDMEPPKWQHLIPDLSSSEPVPPDMSYNLKYLALFAKVGGGRYDTPHMHHQGGRKPMVITVGPDFLGLIMPIRVDGGLDIPEWAAKQ